MYYTVYKITNKINGRFYIGCHKTVNLDDGYMGSGKLIRRAIEKHGIENFEKEILAVFDNPEDMFEMESVLVEHKNPDCYNMKSGGNGGWDHIKLTQEDIRRYSEMGKIKRKWLIENNKAYNEWHKDHLKKMSRELKKKFPNGTMLNKKHSVETKKKIGLTNSKLQSGINNSQYGTMWINNKKLKISKRIPKDENIPDGWELGRVIKF